LLLRAIIHPVDIQDWDGGILLLSTVGAISASQKAIRG
jgi:hypothetical protein